MGSSEGREVQAGSRKTSIPARRRSLKLYARQLNLQIYALYLAYKDARTPWYARAWAILVIGYAFSPIDLIPDFIPLLGYLDDLILVPAGISLALRMIPVEVMSAAREQARLVLDGPEEQRPGPGRRVRWGAVAVIVLIWLGLLVLAVFLFISIFRRSR